MVRRLMSAILFFLSIVQGEHPHTMKTKITLLLLIFTLVLSFAGIAGAQDVEAACFNLAGTSDCELLTGALANTSENLTAFYMDFALDLSVTGLAAIQPTMGDVSLNVTGEGPFVFVGGDGQAPVALALDLNIAANDGTEATETAFSFVLVDDVFYTQNPEDGSWVGFNITQSSDMDMFGIPTDPTEVIDPEALGDFMGLFMALAESVPNHISLERTADDAEGHAVFTYTLDLTGVIQDPELQGVLNDALTAAAQENPMVGMLGLLLPGITGELSVTYHIDTASNLVAGFDFGLDFAIDLNALMAGQGGSDAPTLDPIVLTVDFGVEFTEVGTVTAPTAPEGATIVDLESLGEGSGE